MAIRIGTQEAKTRLSEYLNRVSYRGERIIVERHGKPVAALVTMEDLSRLEAIDQAVARGKTEDEAFREAQFRRLAEETGLVIQYPSGPPVPLSERCLIEVEGPPISEQIIAERR